MKRTILAIIVLVLGISFFLFTRSPYLTEMADKHGYRLDADQALRRLPPLFPEVRDKYYRVSPSYWIEGRYNRDPPKAMTFFWDGKRLRNWGVSYYTAYTLVDVLTSGTTIHSQDLEGPADLLDMCLDGDWIIGSNAPEEKLLQDMESILQKDFNKRIRLISGNRKQPVYVARGNYQFTPLKQDPTDRSKGSRAVHRNQEIKIFEKTLDLAGRGGSGSFKQFLSFVATSLGTTIVDEVSNPPKGMISWMRSEEDTPDLEEEHDQELILKNVSLQTGLTFEKELHVIRRILVESIE